MLPWRQPVPVSRVVFAVVAPPKCVFSLERKVAADEIVALSTKSVNVTENASHLWRH